MTRSVIRGDNLLKRSALAQEIRTAPREGWIDVAKGATILLVVLHHTVQYLGESGVEVPVLSAANDALKTFRMPLFFFASGLFFAKNLTSRFGDLMRYKLGRLFYLTGLWAVIQGAFFAIFPWTVPSFGRWEDVALTFVIPTTVMWYVYALALYGAAAWVLGRLPLWLQIVIAGTVSGAFASGLLATSSWAWDSILSNFIFFFAAMNFRKAFTSVARLPLRWALAPAALWAALVGASFVLNLGVVSPLRIPASFAGIAAAIILARAACDSRVGQALAWVGKTTLPIFVLHIFVIHGVAYYLRGGIDHGALIESAFILGTAAGAVAFSLLAWLALRNVPGLFSAPRILNR